MYLTVQIPMQYCSLQHWTLVSPPDTSTTEHHSCFGPAVSFLLELLEIALHSSPVAHWTLSNLGQGGGGGGGAHLPVSYLIASFTIHRVLVARILEWVAISFSSGPHFLSELFTMTCMSWVAPQGKSHSFTELRKALHHDKAVSHVFFVSY